MEPLSNISSGNTGVKYGELIVLGYNGEFFEADKPRLASKFILKKRSVSNGVKPCRRHVVKNPQTSNVVKNVDQHSISYTLSRSQAVIVEYMEDKDTDMYHIGRSSEVPIDFVVIDTIPGNKRNDKSVVQQSTISRFACRIVINRNPPYTARIFAAGFDSCRNIFLGEKAVKFHTKSEIDGLTTNGVFVMHPQQVNPTEQNPCWREVSVGGNIYALRQSRSAPHASTLIDGEDNILHDWTLIDLCGATLLWRSALGLMSAPSEIEFEKIIKRMNATRPQCPVGLNTLVLPSKGGLDMKTVDKHPYVYINCGHVHGHHKWGIKDDESRTCPLCLKEGLFVQLQMGMELSFYVDSESPSYCFRPCAHMASYQTVCYWSKVTVPHGCHGFIAICPFCATPLDNMVSYIKLIFQDDMT